MRCEEARRRILEQTLEGAFAPAALLAKHLHDCPGCRTFLAHIAEVDLALRALPVRCAPAHVARQALARVTLTGREKGAFLPWTLWVPVASLVAGLLWAYMTLVWPSGPGLITSLDPAVATWLTQFEQWVLTQQATLSAVGISVGAGLFFTLLAIALGLYVGRARVAHSNGHVP